MLNEGVSPLTSRIAILKNGTGMSSIHFVSKKILECFCKGKHITQRLYRYIEGLNELISVQKGHSEKSKKKVEILLLEFLRKGFQLLRIEF